MLDDYKQNEKMERTMDWRRYMGITFAHLRWLLHKLNQHSLALFIIRMKFLRESKYLKINLEVLIMKKRIVSIMMVIALLIISTVAFAEQESREYFLTKKEVKEFSEVLNIDEDLLSRMSRKEAQLLLESDAKLETIAEPSYTIFFELMNKNDKNDCKQLSVNLSKEKYEKEIKKLSKEQLIKKYNDIKSINTLVESEESSMISVRAIDLYDLAYETIDSASLSTQLEVYDASDSTHIKKHVAYDFEWVTAPMWHLTDGLAINHSGGPLKYTVVYTKGGFYEYFLYNQNNFSYLDPEIQENGVKTTFDVNSGSDNHGRMYMQIGNLVNTIEQGEFNIFAQYGHKTISGSVAVSLSSGGGISLTPTLIGDVLESEQLVLITDKYH